MGILVPFRSRTKESSSSEYAARTDSSSDRNVQASHPVLSGNPKREATWEEKWIKVLEAALAAKGEPQRESERRSNRLEKFLTLRELVFFSPEIQGKAYAGDSLSSDGRRGVCPQWGDVFLRVDECYLFAFTVYAFPYVQQCRRVLGETISPSDEDIVLRCRHLTPPDILRAAMKWVNLYRPFLKGKPILLENTEVLQSLIRVPGAEILAPTLLS